MTIRIATSQFPTSGNPTANAEHMAGQITEAARLGADLVHYPEGALSGYAPHDLPNYERYDWHALREATAQVTRTCRESGVWAVFGSIHPLSDGHKPHNSVFVVDRDGQLQDRYDKRFCAGAADDPDSELALYTPGNHACVFSLNDIRLGVLICHEYRYPELYRDYHRQGVQVILHSFHAANVSTSRFAEIEEEVGRENHAVNPATTIPGITMPSAVHAAASSNNLWISCSNSSAPRSCWGALMVRPDGVITGRLETERKGLLITAIDPAEEFYDSTKPWRDRAMDGVLHSGTLVDDPRSLDRRSF